MKSIWLKNKQKQKREGDRVRGVEAAGRAHVKGGDERGRRRPGEHTEGSDWGSLEREEGPHHWGLIATTQDGPWEAIETGKWTDLQK